MKDPQAQLLGDQALDIFKSLRRKPETEGLSDECVAILAAGVLETRHLMAWEGQ